jgi:Na+-transporting NADH:ubiquinone oxidoreductase subunit NqrF
MRVLLDSVNPIVVLDINQARREVAAGGPVEETLVQLDLTTSGVKVVRACLGQIASGQCKAYPKK